MCRRKHWLLALVHSARPVSLENIRISCVGKVVVIDYEMSLKSAAGGIARGGEKQAR